LVILRPALLTRKSVLVRRGRLAEFGDKLNLSFRKVSVMRVSSGWNWSLGMHNFVEQSTNHPGGISGDRCRGVVVIGFFYGRWHQQNATIRCAVASDNLMATPSTRILASSSRYLDIQWEKPTQ
jgi:hypothetical protein